MKLSFMTLVCPEWDIEQILAFARETDYDGVEIRVDAEHKHGISSRSSPETRKAARAMFEESRIAIPCIATSVHFANPDPSVHQANIDAAKANLDLAADLGAPLVRIFAGGGIPELTDPAADQVALAFDVVGEYAAGSGVCPMLECGHDIIKGHAEAAKVIHRASTPNFGVLWNHSRIDDETYEALKSRLRHFHVHDDVLDPASQDIAALVERMRGVHYDRFISLEIIKGHNLPEDQLRETGARIKGYMNEV